MNPNKIIHINNNQLTNNQTNTHMTQNSSLDLEKLGFVAFFFGRSGRWGHGSRREPQFRKM